VLFIFARFYVSEFPFCFRGMRGNTNRSTDQMMVLKPEGKAEGNGQLSLDSDSPYFSVEETKFPALANYKTKLDKTRENVWYCRSITKTL